jgi:ribosomal protein S18 acetylase RimI-like enzyme
MYTVRAATRAEVARIAAMHAERITEGFLPTLGVGFLERLYARVVRSPQSFAIVAVEHGEVVGFVAGTEHLGRLYRTFIVRDGVRATFAVGPRLLRSLRRIWETLRYPAVAEHHSLPSAEILAVATDASCGGRGIGRALVQAALVEFDRRSVGAVKVVAAVHNGAAESLYRGAGFDEHHDLSVHGAVASRAYVRAHAVAPAAPATGTAGSATGTAGSATGRAESSRRGVRA